MKLVHKPLTLWISALCVALTVPTPPAIAQQPEEAPYLAHYNPAKGFKPAQTNLTEIFLQIAGSLEATGSPESYLRHMQEEHRRVDKLFEEKRGKPHASRIPPHMTDAYIERFIRNWNTLSGPLGLDAFAKEIGRCMREGIMGTRLSGTLAVKIFNDHQDLVSAYMQGDSAKKVGFDDLKQRLETDLEFNKKTVSMVGYDLPRRDAVSYALVIEGKFEQMSEKIDSIAKPEKAAQIKKAIAGAFLDLGYMAESELEIGILESALKRL